MQNAIKAEIKRLAKRAFEKEEKSRKLRSAVSAALHEAYRAPSGSFLEEAEGSNFTALRPEVLLEEREFPCQDDLAQGAEQLLRTHSGSLLPDPET